MKGWSTILVAGLAMAIFASSSRPAAPFVIDKTKKEVNDKPLIVPSVFSRAAPQDAHDLKAIQEHVKKVIKKVTPAVVAIQIADSKAGMSAGSGVIIDEDGLVLTAGHVSGKPGRVCQLILADGTKVKGKTLGQNTGVDSGMIRITDKGKYPYVKMGDSDLVKKNDWVLSIGHPGGYKETRKTVVRVGRVGKLTGRTIETDCTLVGGDSGGPLFDMQGYVIGIHSRIGPPITENVHVPTGHYKADWDRLVKGDSWGDSIFPFWGDNKPAPTAYLGVVFDAETKDLKIDEVGEGTPAATAGLKVGDVIVGIDDVKFAERADLTKFMAKKKPGDKVTIAVNRNGEELKIKVTLGKRAK